MDTTLLPSTAPARQPLQLLHYIGTTRDDFSDFPRLAEQFDVVAVDVLGHGKSPPGLDPVGC